MEIISFGDLPMTAAACDTDMGCAYTDCGSCLLHSEKIAVEDVLSAIIRNELSEKERTVLTGYWFEHKKINDLAALCSVSRETVRSLLKKSQNKIYSGLKYVIMYNDMLPGDKLPEDFSFKIIDAKSGKELVS